MQTETETVVAALRGPVTITTDRWGVPHIHAGNPADAFFGQGYAQARMRLFQLDLWRRRGLGLLAEVLGADYVEADAAARTFLSRHPLDAEYRASPPGTAERIEAFVAGINARICEVLADPDLLPPEFSAVGYAPSPWSAGDALAVRVHGLSGNAEEEVARLRTLARFGPDIERVRRPLEPDPGELRIDQELRLSDDDIAGLFDDTLLDVYRAARAPVAFGADPDRAHPDGSNNWALSGARTRTGRPIVASDPHRIMTFPSLRVIVHVTCPEFDLIGMQEPNLPGVVAGHNGHVAFGITIAPADLEDLYVYRLHPDDDGLYRHDGEWRRMEVRVESIAVAGAEPVRRELHSTCHGPVLRIDRARRIAVALRAAWLDPGMAPYLGSVVTMDAVDVDGYLDRLHHWGAPVLNHVVADAGGRIAWQVAGRIPDRSGWDGLLPVPGDGTREWSGRRTAADLPRLVDPEQGWVRSANQYNLDEDEGWRGAPTSHEWYAGFRARRLAEVLASRDDWTVAESARLQNDYLVEPARDLMPYLAGTFADDDAETGRRMLLDWDRRMTADSAAAAIFDRWLYTELPRRLRRAAAARMAPDAAAEAADVLLDVRLLTLGDARADIRLLAESRQWEPDEHFASTHRLVEESLAAAVAALRERLGDDPQEWSWGAVHVTRLVHPLHGVGALDGLLTDTGPHPKSGSADTLGVAFGADGVQTLGAATRIVMDVGDWDSSLWINSPGQDGALDSTHARDLFATWLDDGYLPLIYSRELVERHAEHRLTLRPSTQTASPREDEP